MRSSTRSLAAGLCVTALLVAGCGSDSDDTSSEPEETTSTTEAPAELELTDVWARQSPMGTTAGAIYLDITSAEGDRLVSASVPSEVAGTVEIHETVAADDMGDDMGDDTGDDMGGDDMGDDTGDDMDDMAMTMRPIDGLDLPAGETVSLEPGGYHIMLLDLTEPLVAGDTIELTLEFENAGQQVVTAEVREG